MLQGSVQSSAGTIYEAGSILGHEGIVADVQPLPRAETVTCRAQGHVALILYSETSRAEMYDSEAVHALLQAAAAAGAGDVDAMRAGVRACGERVEPPQETFIQATTHARTSLSTPVGRTPKEDDQSLTHQRNLRIYLTQEVRGTRYL